MTPIVRAIDVGFGNTKYISNVAGTKFRCAHFPSVAPASEIDPRSTMGAGRKTVTIAIDNLYYEVGPEASLAADIYQARQMHDGYCETPEYLALLRGALAYMKVDTIDLLVVGLPVSTFKTKRQGLERRLRGVHVLTGPAHTVTVRRAKVVAQPQGALLHFGTVNNKMAEVNSATNLVVDPGARTFDWLFASGTQLMEKRSGSANRGMFDVLHSIADAISHKYKTDYRDYERLDSALRSGGKVKIFGEECDLSAFQRAAKKIPEDAINEMLRKVGDGNNIDNILLVGGASFYYQDALQRAFPRHTIHELPDPMYANVRGFQSAGQAMAASLTPSSDDESAATPVT